MRQLATIQKIENIEVIENSDNLDKATVLGWEVVVVRDQFKVGDLVIYCEIDSVLPEKPEFEFLRNKKFRIKTIKLRGQTSQGICFSTSILPSNVKIIEGLDVTEILGIKKHLSETEKKENKIIEQKFKHNKFISFMSKYEWFRKLFLYKYKIKNFPSWVSKTDETRLQSIPQVLEQFSESEIFITEKIDYQSVTFTGLMVNKYSFLGKFSPKEYKFIVASRTLQNNDKESLYWKIAEKYNIEKILKANPDLTIQGEQGDTKVQGNKYKLKEPKFWVFNIINHKTGYHYNYEEIKIFCNIWKLETVPLLFQGKLKEIGTTVNEFVEYSKGKSTLFDIHREGIVVREIKNGNKLLSFKVINPDFLLKYEND